MWGFPGELNPLCLHFIFTRKSKHVCICLSCVMIQELKHSSANSKPQCCGGGASGESSSWYRASNQSFLQLFWTLPNTKLPDNHIYPQIPHWTHAPYLRLLTIQIYVDVLRSNTHMHTDSALPLCPHSRTFWSLWHRNGALHHSDITAEVWTETIMWRFKFHHSKQSSHSLWSQNSLLRFVTWQCIYYFKKQ